ncbi:hypothetical protein EV385_0967 [Krasilnikovia cinnamomea]|uniref:Uncharacterized protein n=1 Tax=Krasilnikovia cinnamomea TaxID=349313 RepID=A0A4V2G6M2_9ACTN|nr:hypothetical protein [Krasilnikovia cinnamomea]RZU49226.1 hypothetical protein EV385_0967 [Krasilnikovia cinnamomea]
MTSLAVRRVAGWHRPLVVFAALMGVAALATLVGIVADPRVLTGVPIWLKPFKFAVSFGVYTLTIAWMLSLLPRRSRLAEWAATAIVATAAVEMAVIVGQVVRGQTSHYNETTPLNAALWQAMGTAIMVLFAAQFVVTAVLLRQRQADRVAGYGLRLGLGLSLLGLAAAIPMVLPTAAPDTPGIAGAHSVGVPDGGPGLPLVGWSTVGGDLRVGHFVGLHALQALPLLALLLGRFAGHLDEAVRARLMLVAGAAYGGLTVLLTWQALRGQPLLRPDGLTLAAFGVLAAATVAATVAVLRGEGGKDREGRAWVAQEARR